MARTRICSFELDPRGFVRATVDLDAHMDTEDAEEALALTFEVAGRQRRPVLVDLRGIRSQSRGARLYFASPAVAERLAAVGLLIASPVSKVLGNFFLRLQKQPVPTELFHDEEAAVDWLLAFTR